jgi:hypothetical protein
VSDEEKEFEDSKIRRYKELEKAWDDMELDEMESKTFDEDALPEMRQRR